LSAHLTQSDISERGVFKGDISNKSTSGGETIYGEALDIGALDAFVERVWLEGRRLYRSYPWRDTDDAYLVLTSEVMLQQTQVSRVHKKWESWLAAFPTLDALAAASLVDVLERWQGMGYNRRAINLKRCADYLSENGGGMVPNSYEELLTLPGVGPATAAGVCVFAYQIPQVYLETNVRTVFIHELFADHDSIHDREIIPLVRQTCPASDPRAWYYALLDYGAYLKRILPNPNRRAAGYHRQSAFEGSTRQKRAELLRLVLSSPGLNTEELTELLMSFEWAAGRSLIDADKVALLLEALEKDGFLTTDAGRWYIAEKQG